MTNNKLDKLRKLSKDEIIQEAFIFIANRDENATIIPDGKINDGAEFMGDFIHYLWETDSIYDQYLDN